MARNGLTPYINGLDPSFLMSLSCDSCDSCDLKLKAKQTDLQAGLVLLKVQVVHFGLAPLDFLAHPVG